MPVRRRSTQLPDRDVGNTVAGAPVDHLLGVIHAEDHEVPGEPDRGNVPSGQVYAASKGWVASSRPVDASTTWIVYPVPAWVR